MEERSERDAAWQGLKVEEGAESRWLWEASRSRKRRGDGSSPGGSGRSAVLATPRFLPATRTSDAPPPHTHRTVTGGNQLALCPAARFAGPRDSSRRSKRTALSPARLEMKGAAPFPAQNVERSKTKIFPLPSDCPRASPPSRRRRPLAAFCPRPSPRPPRAARAPPSPAVRRFASRLLGGPLFHVSVLTFVPFDTIAVRIILLSLADGQSLP